MQIPPDLLAAATAARDRAHAPYSRFRVGAALQDERGAIYTGCNIENATYGLTMCAERVAVFKAVSEGAGPIVSAAVVADTDTLTPPCGACRQILWEFCPQAQLFLANLRGEWEAIMVREIFPRPFDERFL